MNFDEYRTLFVVGSLLLILAAAFPGLSLVVPIPEGGERFSELWLLGPELMAEGYPFDVRVGETNGPVYVGVCNHMGSSQYYLVYAKLRNQTEPLPNATASQPSPLPPLYEARFFLADGEKWEEPLLFSVEEALFKDATAFVSRISIDQVVLSVSAHTRWDSEYSGFYYQLFFELWLYDAMLQSFEFHNRFVGIWLNVTRG